MSIDLDLDVVGLAVAQGRAVEQRSRRPGVWPVAFWPARQVRAGLFRRRMSEPSLAFADQEELFDGEAFTGRERTAWVAQHAAGAFAAAIEVLGDELPQGFALRAAWVGDPVDGVVTLAAGELAALASARGLVERIRYVVPASAA